MFIACIIWVVGSALMCAVQDVAMLIVSRGVNGFAVGMLTSQGFVFQVQSQLRSKLPTKSPKTYLHR
jgi:hypothetical protein